MDDEGLAESIGSLGLSNNFKEFRPGQGLVSTTTNAWNTTTTTTTTTTATSISDNNDAASIAGNSMKWNVTAKEFKLPNHALTTTTTVAAPSSYDVAVHTDDSLQQQPRKEIAAIAEVGGDVQVYRNGECITVPISEAHLYDEDEAHSNNVVNSRLSDEQDDDGISWWAKGTSTIPAAPQCKSLHSLGSADTMWLHFRSLARVAMQEMEPNDPRHKAVPLTYSNAFCLDNHGLSLSNNSPVAFTVTAGSFGYPSNVFKVISREDGLLYCLRRLDNVKCVSNKICAAVNETWSKIRHAGICQFHKCFISQRALFFVHEYQPGGKTLKEKYLDHGGKPQLLQERLLWSYTTQLVAAIRTVHANRLACRCLQPNHILRTSGGRLRISCVGIADALEFEARKSLAEIQREDMVCLGRIILSLATRTMITPSTNEETLRACGIFLAQHYSSDLHALTSALLSKPPSVYEVCGIMANHTMDELDNAYATCDAYSNQLAAEYESGRALRLLLKLGFVNERPEFGVNRQWAETGDCYVLKLFRDFVFHQADETGRPILDLGHVVTALNKLDASDTEKIVLASRDGKAILVVSYAEVANCLENAYSELCAVSSEGQPTYGGETTADQSEMTHYG